MDDILKSIKFVVDKSKYVKIDSDKVQDFCENVDHKHVKHWIREGPFDLKKLNDKDLLHFLLVFNSISFSYWGNPKWGFEYRGKSFDGSWGMIAALGKAVENNIPILDPRYLARLSEENFEKISKANIKIPLFNERLKILKELGNILIKKFNGDFSNLVKQSGGDAVRLLDLIIMNFPFFEDVSTYKGRKIYFYKRAQLLVSDIYQIFDGEGYGKLKNIQYLTACADYKLPFVLRKLGILSYSHELAKKIDEQIEINLGSEEEIEIRANTILAVELIKKLLKEKIPKVDSIHVNDHLWLLGQNRRFNEFYHLTRTISY